MRPMHFVCLADMHILAVPPLVGLGELTVVLVVVSALKTQARCASTSAMYRTGALLVVLADREVLSAEMPMHVDRTKPFLPIWFADRGSAASIDLAFIAHGHVGT